MEPMSQPAPVRPAPVMDVTAPKPASAPTSPQNLAQDKLQDPKAAEASKKPNPAKPAATKNSSPASNSASTAIILAIIFFLALSALAFFAYTKSNK